MNGISEIVTQSVELYQNLLDRIDYLETVEDIRKELEEKQPALEALRAELKFPRDE